VICDEAAAAGGSASGGVVVSDVSEAKAMEAAAQFAVATSFLTYPATLVQMLGGSECGRDLVERAATRLQPLVICVLGASDSAELAHTSVWKVSGVCC
jgi:hypothetical protein